MSDHEPERETVDLVRRAQAGDDDAFEDVVRRAYPKVRQIVRARIGPGLRQVAESGDVVQEAMGEVVRGLGDFEMRDDDALIKWIAGLVENRLRDMAKYHGRAKRDAGRVIPLVPKAPGDTTNAIDPARSTQTPLEKASDREMAERLRVAVKALEPKHREVIERRGEGLTWGEVAKAMDLPSEGAARMLHSRAKVALMNAVAKGTGDGSV